MEPKRVDVAVGIVVRGGRILVCRRKPDGPLGGFYEFPGGKREPGESIQSCLARELREELGIEVSLTAPLRPIEHTYDHATVVLHPFVCALTAGEPTPLACQSVHWTDLAGLKSFTFPPANDSMLAELARRLPTLPADH